MTLFSDPVVISGSLTVSGRTILAGQTDLPEEVVLNSTVAEGTDISASKLQHRNSIGYRQEEGTDVVDQSRIVHLVRAPGTIKSVKVRLVAPPAGGNKTVTVDVQKAADGSGSYSSLLTAPIEIDSGSSANTVLNGVLTSPASVTTNDAIRVVVDAEGSTGTQAQGIFVDIQIDESGV